MSLKPGWIIALISAWLVTQIVFAVCEATYIGSGQVGVFSRIMSPDAWESQNFFSAIFSGFAVAWDYFRTFWDMLWWNYAFLNGPWAIVKLFLQAITGGFGLSFVITLIKR